MNEETSSKTEDETVITVWPNTAEPGAHVVIPHSMKRAKAGPGEILKIRLSSNGKRIEHAWVEPSIDLKGQTREQLESSLRPAIHRFLTAVMDREPDLNEGIASTLKLTIGQVGYDDDDNAIYQMIVKVTHEETI